MISLLSYGGVMFWIAGVVLLILARAHHYEAGKLLRKVQRIQDQTKWIRTREAVKVHDAQKARDKVSR